MLIVLFIGHRQKDFVARTQIGEVVRESDPQIFHSLFRNGGRISNELGANNAFECWQSTNVFDSKLRGGRVPIYKARGSENDIRALIDLKGLLRINEGLRCSFSGTLGGSSRCFGGGGRAISLLPLHVGVLDGGNQEDNRNQGYRNAYYGNDYREDIDEGRIDRNSERTFLSFAIYSLLTCVWLS